MTAAIGTCKDDSCGAEMIPQKAWLRSRFAAGVIALTYGQDTDEHIMPIEDDRHDVADGPT